MNVCDCIVNPIWLNFQQNPSMARIYFYWPCARLQAGQQNTFRKTHIFLVVLFLTFIGLVMLATMHYHVIHGLGQDKSGRSSVQEESASKSSSQHYAIVIDCGSSGSRIYVYFWPPHSGNPKDLLNIQQLRDSKGKAVVKKVSPGLSDCEEKPQDASEHIRPLLEYAAQYIPKEHHKETPLYILATAGMRMLPEKSQKVILDDLQTDLPKMFNFLVADNHFEVISGKIEGVYAWIAVNYILDKFSHGEGDHPLVSVKLPGTDGKTHIRRQTVGMIDMGGGSVQIAFEVLNEKTEIPKHLVAEINLGCQDSDLEHIYRVYVTTFLGYGANSARERYEATLIKKSTVSGQLKIGKNQSVPIADSCLPKEMPLKSEDENGVKHYFKGTGKFEMCKTALRPLLNLTVPCKSQFCSMNGVDQPDIDFSRASFYGFSEFWYTMEDVLRLGGQYRSEKFHHEAGEFCGRNWSTLTRWYQQKFYPKADKSRFEYQCFKSAWMSTVFHEGFKFPLEYKNFKSAQKISNKDVQWTLGALIYRTRYVPLRDIEKQLEAQASYRTSHVYYNEYLIIICFIIVLTAIFLYMQRLRLCPGRKDISRVPSMSYFMIEEDQMEQGIHAVKGYDYL